MNNNDFNRLSNTFRRDPSKRQIKQTFNEVLFYDEAEDESDDDFKVEEKESDSDDSISETDSECSNDKSESKASSSASSILSVSEVIEESLDEKAKIKVCMVCYDPRDTSPEDLMECDRCGIIVHEECYKVPDNIFIVEPGDSSTTDPWVCEPCLCDVENPLCQMCPNKSGVFKRTDNNSWIHLVCALYIRGVAFNDPENFMGITLTEIQKQEWSSKECVICKEPFFSWSGICIHCDAGLCKNTFHVTCENPSDPYFAQCIQHSDKESVKARKRTYQTSYKPNIFVKKSDMKKDFLENFLSFQKNYQALFSAKTIPYVPTLKNPILLQHSPSALRLFSKKALILGLPIDKMTGDFSSSDDRTRRNMNTENSISSTKNILQYSHPGFSIEFLTYFNEREKRIKEILNDSRQMSKNFKKIEEEIDLVNASHKKEIEKSSLLQGKKKNLKQELESILLELNQIYHFNISQEVSRLIDIRMNETSRQIKKESPVENERICKSCNCPTQDSYNCIECYKCKMIYHTFCLDPPISKCQLNRRGFVWYCSECSKMDDKSNLKTSQESVDISQPRKLRACAGEKGKKIASIEKKTTNMIKEIDDEFEEEKYASASKKPRYSSLKEEEEDNNDIEPESLSDCKSLNKTCFERLKECVLIIDDDEEDLNKIQDNDTDEEGEIIHVLREVQSVNKIVYDT